MKLWELVVLIGAMIGVALMFGNINATRIEETVNNLKYDNCVTEMQKAIPDPNDTQTRSKFLKECYE